MLVGSTVTLGSWVFVGKGVLVGMIGSGVFVGNGVLVGVGGSVGVNANGPTSAACEGWVGRATRAISRITRLRMNHVIQATPTSTGWPVPLIANRESGHNPSNKTLNNDNSLV